MTVNKCGINTKRNALEWNRVRTNAIGQSSYFTVSLSTHGSNSGIEISKSEKAMPLT
jgi:hypothetical protein